MNEALETIGGIISGFIGLALTALTIAACAFVGLVLIKAARKAAPSMLRAALALGEWFGNVLRGAFEFMVIQARVIIGVAVIALTIATTLHGAIDVFYAYRADLPAFIPAVLVLLAVGAVGLERQSLGALLAGGVTALVGGAAVLGGDGVFRSLVIVGALMVLVFIGQSNKPNLEDAEMGTKKNSTAFMTLMKIGLVVYTMARSIDLVSNTLPDEQGMKILGLFVVFGLDIALLVWDNYTADPYKARSDGQAKVGALMIVLNMLGVGAALIADSARMLDPVGSRSLIYTVSIYGIPAVIICNLAGMIGVNQLDPDRVAAQARAQHERALIALQDEHDQAVELANKQAELAVVRLGNDNRIKRLKDRYFQDDNNNGRQDPGEVSAGTLDELMRLLSQTQGGKRSPEVTTYAANGHGHDHAPKA